MDPLTCGPVLQAEWRIGSRAGDSSQVTLYLVDQGAYLRDFREDSARRRGPAKRSASRRWASGSQWRMRVCPQEESEE